MTVLVNCKSLQSRRQFLSLSILYDIWKGRTRINFSDYFEFNTLCTRSHSLTLKVFSSTINAFRHCFFVSVAFLWNTIPEDILARNQVKHFRSRLKQFILMCLLNSVLVLCMLFCFCNCIFVTVRIVCKGITLYRHMPFVYPFKQFDNIIILYFYHWKFTKVSSLKNFRLYGSSD